MQINKPLMEHDDAGMGKKKSGRIKINVGWREWLTLPDLDVPAIKAKLDTGARTSALHATSIDPFTKDGKPFVRFTVQPLQHRIDIVRICEAPLVDRRYITDSGSHRELRYIISTHITMGDMSWLAEISLTDRQNMIFRMLLGRTAMRRALTVDPGISFRTRRINDSDAIDIYQ